MAQAEFPQRIALKDGGMGQELQKRSRNPATPLWMTQIVMDAPEVVVDAHRAFIDAGAEIITLASYSMTPQRLARDGNVDHFDALQAAAIDIARRACAKSARDVRIAGCLPPLVASYRPDLTPPAEESRASYRRIAAAQAAAVDLFICETLSSVAEARFATEAAAETGKPVWTALTVIEDASGRLRSGEPVAEGAAAALEAGAEAVLVNCARPEAVAAALEPLSAAAPVFGAYANGFDAADALAPGGTVDVLTARDDVGPAAYAEHALAWARVGARIIGGCCEIGPAHIAAVAARFAEAGIRVGDRP